MTRRPLAALLLVVALTGCDGGAPSADAGPERAEGSGDAAAPAVAPPVVLRDGVQAAPGTRVIPPGPGTTGTGWYAALDLAGAEPADVAAFYREHLAALGLTVDPTTGPSTVVATRPVGPTTRVRVDVVPTSGEVPGFVRLVATSRR